MTTYSLVKPRDLTNTAAFSGDLTAKWLYVDNADGNQAEKLSLSALDARYAGAGTYLVAANNLSDLTNAATARTNLGLVAAGAGDIWVEKAGDTMTGDLNLGTRTLYIDQSRQKKGQVAQATLSGDLGMLIGYSYTSGADLEIYPDDHASRPGDFRALFGSHTGSSNFIVNHYDGGSTFSSLIKATINGSTLAGSFTINDNGRDVDFVVEGTSNATLLIVDASTNRAGINVPSPAAKLHIDQSSATAAIPVLLLNQADVSEQCIKVSAGGVDQDINILTVDVTGTPTISWDESEDAFSFSKNVIITGGSITGITDLAIADGGTGASTAQAAINALTQVSGATNEHVLTKDTSTGNATWKAAAGGSSLPVVDETAIVYKTGSPAITATLDANSLTTARTYTLPDVSSTVAVTGLAQTFTAAQAFAANTVHQYDVTKYLTSSIDSSGIFSMTLTGGSQINIESAVLSVNRRFQCTGNTAPTTGKGLEFGGTSTIGTMLAYDRDTPKYLDFILRGSTITIGSGSSGSTRFYIDTTGKIALGGSTSPSAQLMVEQSSASAAVPTLYLKQSDVSEQMITLETTIGTGNAIEAVGAKTLTTTHFIKITITGVGTRYIPVGTIA